MPMKSEFAPNPKLTSPTTCRQLVWAHDLPFSTWSLAKLADFLVTEREARAA
jgi:hypothetical protein